MIITDISKPVDISPEDAKKLERKHKLLVVCYIKLIKKLRDTARDPKLTSAEKVDLMDAHAEDQMLEWELINNDIEKLT